MDLVGPCRVGTANIPTGQALLSGAGIAYMVGIPRRRAFFCGRLAAEFSMHRSTFSSAFKTGAFYLPSKASMVFNILINLALYALFTIVCFGAASPPSWLVEPVNKRVADSSAARRLPPALKRVMTVKKMAGTEVVAVCFCGAAKTISVGIPLADAMWAEHDDLTKSMVQVPVLLYTTEQVFVAQFLTIFFRWWLERHQNPPTDEELIVPGKPETASSGEPVLGRREDGTADNLSSEQRR